MVNKTVLLACLLFCISGCSLSGPGWLYSNVTLPYSTDFNRTSVVAKKCELKDHRVKEPMSGYGVTVEWSTSQIQSSAQEAGISRIRYIDIQTISFVLGIYTRRKLIIYGD